MFTSIDIRIKCKSGNIDNVTKNFINVLKFGSSDSLENLQCNDNICFRHLEPEIINIRQDRENHLFSLKIPSCLGGYDSGLSMLLNSMSYLSVFSDIEKYSILDISMPEYILSQYQGPRHGIIGIRQKFNIPKRALLGMIMKPRTRPDLNKFNQILNQVSQTGIDYIIDDELIVNPFCANLDRRLEMYSTYRSSKIFFVNATANIEQSLEIIEKALKLGINGIMLNAITMGLPAIKYIIDKFCGEPIFIVNNIGRGIITRHENFGISESVYAFLTRLVGADAVYTGPLSNDFIYNDSTLKEEVDILQKKSLHIKESFAVASGGINFDNILNNTKVMGTNLMLQMGSSLLSEPYIIPQKIALFNGILESLSLADNNVDSVIDNLSFLVNQNKTNNKGQIYMDRINDLKSNISNDYELLKEYEDSLRYENDPKKKVQYKREIKNLRGSINSYYIEIESLTASDTIMEDMQYREIRKGIADDLIKQHFEEIKNELEDEIENISATMASLYNDKNTPQELKNELGKIVNEPELNNKLKLSIPIIPLLLSYETSLDVKMYPYSLWKRILKFWKKK